MIVSKVKKHLILFIGLSFSLLSFAEDLKIGGLYSVPHENNSYVIVKIIQTDSIGVHISLYSNIFHKIPEYINESELVILPSDNLLGFPEGTLHVAISHKGFKHWGASFIQLINVNKAELKAYNNWFESKGGYY